MTTSYADAFDLSGTFLTMPWVASKAIASHFRDIYGEITPNHDLTGFWPEDDWEITEMLGQYGTKYCAVQSFKLVGLSVLELFCLSEGLLGPGEMRIRQTEDVPDNQIYFDVTLYYSSMETIDYLKVGLARSRYSHQSEGHGLLLLQVSTKQLSLCSLRTV
ncbi:hypothetical protein WG66_005959 [Moniliophthora roreri]|nr:hypothetical protein WG66_005959 [Moniliophthora roreri]